MPVSLVLLALIALTCYILFNYLLVNTEPGAPYNRFWRPLITILVIFVVLLLWYVLPVSVGR